MDYELIAKFINYLKIERHLSSHTASNYQRDLKGFHKFAESSKLSIDAIPTARAREYLIQLEREKFNRKSIARKISALRSFFKFLVQEELAAKTPWELLLRPNFPPS